MATHIVLPDDASQAKEKFIKILERDDETLLLVLWDDDTASAANELLKKLAKKFDGDPFYDFLNLVSAPDPKRIIPVLQDLDIDDGLTLDDIENTVIVSISPFRNIISEVVSKERFQNSRGSVTTAINAAMANG